MASIGKNFSRNNTSGKRNKGDFYQTPYSLTRLLLDNIKPYGTIADPCCGDGAIAKVIREKGFICLTGDIKYGFDFLTQNYSMVFDWIITNPPYSMAFEFIKKAKEKSNNIAFLMPLSYLHGKERYIHIWQDKEFPLHDLYIFTRRPMLRDTLREDGKHETGMMDYAWFVWEKKPKKQGPELHWIDNDEFVVRGGV